MRSFRLGFALLPYMAVVASLAYNCIGGCLRALGFGLRALGFELWAVSATSRASPSCSATSRAFSSCSDTSRASSNCLATTLTLMHEIVIVRAQSLIRDCVAAEPKSVASDSDQSGARMDREQYLTRRRPAMGVLGVWIGLCIAIAMAASGQLFICLRVSYAEEVKRCLAQVSKSKNIANNEGSG
ncbi:hypothetical protein BX070DRAFT_54755 [Coemansia spiralis]|nr:hypothetical protein BX070DRAFT_54755 [Coemansia spiralis]